MAAACGPLDSYFGDNYAHFLKDTVSFLLTCAFLFLILGVSSDCTIFVGNVNVRMQQITTQ